MYLKSILLALPLCLMLVPSRSLVQVRMRRASPFSISSPALLKKCRTTNRENHHLFGSTRGQEESSYASSTPAINTNSLPRLYIDDHLPTGPTVITRLRALTRRTIRQQHHGPSLFSKDRVIPLSPDQSHYLSTVLRLSKSGGGGKKNRNKRSPPLVRLFDPSGEEWLAELLLNGNGNNNNNNKKRRHSGSESVVAVCQEQLRSLQKQQSASSSSSGCWLLVAPPKKKDRLRWMVEKTTELGVTGYCWLDTAFSESSSSTKSDRAPFRKLLAHAVEAAEQCERLTLPQFVKLETGEETAPVTLRDKENNDPARNHAHPNQPDTSLDHMLSTAPSIQKDVMEINKLADFFDMWKRERLSDDDDRIRILVCRERSNTVPVWHVLEHVFGSAAGSSTSPTVVFLIGPEGGWSPQENEQMDNLQREKPGLFWNVSLGPYILRAETAAVTAVAAYTLFADAKQS